MDSMDSILVTIRSGLGVDLDFSGFDGEIIMAVNSAIFSLSQLGVGPEVEFAVTGIDETWEELFGEVSNLQGVKSYILVKTRLVFDPPTTSFLIGAVERQNSELEWRLMIEVDPVMEEE